MESEINPSSNAHELEGGLQYSNNITADLQVSRFLKNFSLTVLIIVSIWTFAVSVLQIYYKNAYVWLHKRDFPLMLIFVLGVFFSLYPLAWRFYREENISCFSLVVSEYVLAVTLFIPITARLLRYHLLIVFNKALVDFNYDILTQEKFLKIVGPGGDHFISNSMLQLKTDEYQPGLHGVLFRICFWKPPTELQVSLRIKHFWSSHRAIYLLSGLLTLLFLLVGFFHAKSQENRKNCTLDETIVVSFPVVFVFVSLCILVLHIHRRIPDGLGIKHEIKLICLVLLLIESIKFVLYLNFQEYEEEGLFSWFLLYYLQVLAILTISFPYQVYLAIQQQHICQEDDSVKIGGVISNDFGLKAFSLFLATALCVENTLFYKEILDWKGSNKLANSERCITQAKIIYTRFISIEGDHTLNIPYLLRDILHQRFENNDISLNMFDGAVKIVLSLLETEIFLRFKKTVYYLAYKGSIFPEDIKYCL